MSGLRRGLMVVVMSAWRCSLIIPHSAHTASFKVGCCTRTRSPLRLVAYQSGILLLACPGRLVDDLYAASSAGPVSTTFTQVMKSLDHTPISDTPEGKTSVTTHKQSRNPKGVPLDSKVLYNYYCTKIITNRSPAPYID
jgi:hypothetical protein